MDFVSASGEIILQGLVLGMLLFLVSVGLTLVFGMLGVVNFAHGTLYMFGAYLGYTVAVNTGSFLLALVIAPLGVALIGVVIELLALRPLYGKSPLFQILLTFGISLILSELIRVFWGGLAKLPDVPGALGGSVELFGSLYPVYRLFIMGCGLLLAIILWQIMERTRFGMIIRAASHDREMVGMLGINIKLVFTIIFALGAALAAFGGVIAAPLVSANLEMGINMVIGAFIVVVVGGLGSFKGSFLGSIIIGEMQSFGVVLVPDFSLALVFILMAFVLVIRPQGLFGRLEARVR